MIRSLILISFAALIFLISGCSGSKESYDRKGKGVTGEGSQIRVLLDEKPGNYKFISEGKVYLKDGDSYLTIVNKGKTLSLNNSGDEVEIEVGEKNYKGKDLRLVPESSDVPVSYKGNTYSGTINFIPDGNGITVINQLSVEDYLKGVIPREMPAGKGKEYYEALKAFTICARTYTFSKLKENKKKFDVFADTRDQVYGGRGIEKEMINDIVEETRGLILTYNNKPAVTFYSSTCGGYTEDARNVFSGVDLPYLKGVRDGDEPYCSVSPKYKWTELFTEQTFVERLVSAGYLDDAGYSIDNISVNSTFRSGRINELEIELKDKLDRSKTVNLYGNKIRYVIRTADNKSILESNNFNVIITRDRQIIINGKGFGHGVGLCQWGALQQSVEGKNFEDILLFYYPGTKIENYND